MFEPTDLIRYFNSYVDQLNTEVTYAIKLGNHLSANFGEILLMEVDFVSFLFDVREFFLLEAEPVYQNDVTLKVMEHTYHLSDDFALNSQTLSHLFENENISDCVGKLSAFINSNTRDPRLKIQAQLMLSFNLALNVRQLAYAKSLLMEALSTRIVSKKQSTVFIFNRSLALLGLGFFKLGDFEECKSLLHELMNSESPDSLLG